MLNTLTIALTYHEFFRHSDMAGLAVETGGMGMAVSDSHGDAAGLRTDGLVFKVLHDYFPGALPVEVRRGKPEPGSLTWAHCFAPICNPMAVVRRNAWIIMLTQKEKCRAIRPPRRGTTDIDGEVGAR
jgi:hypothetical protein